MSQVFSTLAVAQTGMGAYKLWIDAVADNVANIDNVSPTDQAAFQERFVMVSAVESDNGAGRGVVVTGAAFGDPNGRLTYEPTHPLADENGMGSPPGHRPVRSDGVSPGCAARLSGQRQRARTGA